MYKTDYTVILVLTLVHFTGDFYSSFFSPLLPVFVDKLELSLAQAGFITGMVRFISFIIQPVTGYLADRYESRSFVFSGLFLAFFTIPFSGLADNFWILLLILCLGSVGSSVFHPATTGMVPLYAGKNPGLCLSIYNTGGTLAFAAGPVFISWFVSRYGLSNMPLTGILGGISFLFCLKFLPVPVSENLSRTGFIGSLKELFFTTGSPILLIWIIMVLRAITGQSFMTFMPVHLTQMHLSLIAVGQVVACFIFAGTLSGLAAGFLADRIDVRKVFFFSHLLMPPTLLWYLNASGSTVFPAAFMAGAFALAPLPLGVVMAQKFVPDSRAMVSSLMMGFAYGLGGLFSPLIGKLADLFSLETVLFYSALIPIIALPLILRLPQVPGRPATPGSVA